MHAPSGVVWNCFARRETQLATESAKREMDVGLVSSIYSNPNKAFRASQLDPAKGYIRNRRRRAAAEAAAIARARRKRMKKRSQQQTGGLEKAEKIRAISAEYAKRAISQKTRSRISLTEYQQYLQGEHWRTFRFNVILERGCCCESCGSQTRLKDINLHHKTYARLGRELPTDVVLLCRLCHAGVHLPDHREGDLRQQDLSHAGIEDQLREADFIAVKREKRDSQLAWVEQESDCLKAAATG